jgi:hypothetical protein
MCVSLAYGRDNKTDQERTGLGFSIEVDAPIQEVLDAVEEVANSGIIQGSKEYEKDKFVSGAAAVTSCSVFPKWSEQGTVFYKVKEEAIAPRNFYAASASGILAVRYVVQSKPDPNKTILKIDAIYVESEHQRPHPSNGSVESAEYKDVKDHIEAAQAQKKEAVEAEKRRSERLAQETLQKTQQDEASQIALASDSEQVLQLQVDKLRKQVERVAGAGGASLKSAPFHTATVLRQIPAGAEVVILVFSSHWYGVETSDGQHGWIRQDELEKIP